MLEAQNYRDPYCNSQRLDPLSNCNFLFLFSVNVGCLRTRYFNDINLIRLEVHVRISHSDEKITKIAASFTLATLISSVSRGEEYNAKLGSCIYSLFVQITDRIF